MSILDHFPAAKPVQQSASAQGIAIAAAPLIASLVGLDPNDVLDGLNGAIQAAGLAWALYGVLRRLDIRLPWQRPYNKAIDDVSPGGTA